MDGTNRHRTAPVLPIAVQLWGVGGRGWGGGGRHLLAHVGLTHLQDTTRAPSNPFRTLLARIGRHLGGQNPNATQRNARAAHTQLPPPHQPPPSHRRQAAAQFQLSGNSGRDILTPTLPSNESSGAPGHTQTLCGLLDRATTAMRAPPHRTASRHTTPHPQRTQFPDRKLQFGGPQQPPPPADMYRYIIHQQRVCVQPTHDMRVPAAQRRYARRHYAGGDRNALRKPTSQGQMTALAAPQHPARHNKGSASERP